MIDLPLWESSAIDQFTDKLIMADLHVLPNLFKYTHMPVTLIAHCINAIRNKFPSIDSNVLALLIFANEPVVTHIKMELLDQLPKSVLIHHLTSKNFAAWLYCRQCIIHPQEQDSVTTNAEPNIDAPGASASASASSSASDRNEDIEIDMSALKHCLNFDPIIQYEYVKPIVDHCSLKNKIRIINRFESICTYLTQEEFHTILCNNELLAECKFSNFLPLIKLYAGNGEWDIQHQLRLLEDIHIRPHTVVIDIVNSTMPFFTQEQQRVIWNTLSDCSLMQYEKLDWYQIDEAVLPCHQVVTKELISVLYKRGCNRYDYYNELIDYALVSHPSVLRELLTKNLLSITDPLWDYFDKPGHKLALTKFWVSYIPSYHHFHRFITGYMDCQIVQSYLMKNLVTLWRWVQSPSFYKELFTDEIIAEFGSKISYKMRHALYTVIPKLIDMGLYERNRIKIASFIMNTGCKIDHNSALVHTMVTDFAKSRVSIRKEFFKCITLDSLYPLQCRLWHRIFTDNPDLLNVDSDIIGALCFALHIPLRPHYVQSLLDTVGYGRISLKYILPHMHVVTVSERAVTYGKLIKLYNHYSRYDGLHNIRIAHEVLVDMVSMSRMDGVMVQIIARYANDPVPVTYGKVKHVKIDTVKRLLDTNKISMPYNDLILLNKHHRGKLDKYLSVCPICHESMTNPKKIKTLTTCTHAFHVKCINQWLQIKAACPCCRASTY